jgi:hypothetical protein
MIRIFNNPVIPEKSFYCGGINPFEVPIPQWNRIRP